MRFAAPLVSDLGVHAAQLPMVFGHRMATRRLRKVLPALEASGRNLCAAVLEPFWIAGNRRWPCNDLPIWQVDFRRIRAGLPDGLAGLLPAAYLIILGAE